MSVPNWKAMQVATVITKGQVQAPSKPGDVKPRYLVGGAWRADLSKHGVYRPK